MQTASARTSWSCSTGQAPLWSVASGCYGATTRSELEQTAILQGGSLLGCSDMDFNMHMTSHTVVHGSPESDRDTTDSGTCISSAGV
jgi:hypothetical protein